MCSKLLVVRLRKKCCATNGPKCFCFQILSDEELSKLVAEASKFEGKFVKYKCLGVYNAIVRANKVRFTALRTLRSLVKGERPENENLKYPKGV